MSDEEKEIAASTPRFRIGAPAPSPKPAEEAVEFVEAALRAPDEAVVLFALEWHEFSWSVGQLFLAIGVTYRSGLGVPYQENNCGTRIHPR